MKYFMKRALAQGGRECKERKRRKENGRKRKGRERKKGTEG